MRAHPRTRTASWAAGLLAVALPAAAQTLSTAPPQPSTTARAAAPPAFNSARTPTSPAFTLFGLEPSSVERPSNPSALALAFVTQAKDSGTVPEDFAVEFSPFWLVSQPNLTWSGDKTRTVWESLQRTASFSIATGEIGNKDAPVRGLGFGGRASLLSGRLSKESEAEITRLEGLLTEQAKFLNSLMAPALKELNRQLLAKEISTEKFTEEMGLVQAAAVRSKLHKESAEYKAIAKVMEKFATVRDGLFLEVAGAAGWRYRDATWAEGRFDRWGLWVTPSYVAQSSSVVGVLRYLSEDADAGTGEGVLDFGFRGIHFRDRYAVSLEYVRRTFRADALNGGHRFVGIAEYAVTDGTWLVATFGRDHDTRREGSLIARLGLSFDFNKERNLVSAAGSGGGGRNVP